MHDVERSHFWLGKFLNEEHFADYIKEIYDENDEDREYTPLSKFAKDQGKLWYNCDAMESGFRGTIQSIEHLTTGHSYAEHWSTELCRRAAEAGIRDVNAILFITANQIKNPRSIELADYQMHYLGTIDYPT